MMEFQGFNKISRLSRNCVITEKIDGTNAQICITEEGEFLVGSRRRWITPENDNYGFARWAYDNKEELMKLGEGRHYGEWWGQGVQRRYSMDKKVFSLFNTGRWSNDELRPKCCSVVPVLYAGMFYSENIDNVINELKEKGSVASPGFMDPEGIVIFHKASGGLYKKTIKDDEVPKSVSTKQGA